MKNYLTLFAVCFAVLAVGLMHSCKKDSMGSNVYVPPPPPSPPPPPAITTNYSEEFSDYNEFVEKGWETSGYTTTNINTYVWTAGSFGATGKGDSVWYGFTAYSYTLYPTEYFYAYSPAVDSKLSISSWLLSPPLKVKAGDTISFYTRGDTTGVYTDRMQVLLNKTASTNVGHELTSVGDFTTSLFEINAAQAYGGYPTNWTKYEYVVTGITDGTVIRIGFRRFVTNPGYARGIGIDLFRFAVK